MRLLYFNPENDLALAANDPHYTPPASARQMAYDLREFPRLWTVKELIPKDSTAPCSSLALWKENDAEGVLPWGWSPLAVCQLRSAGVAESLLPSAVDLEAYRQFSSRQTAVLLLKKIRERWPSDFEAGYLTGESGWCRTEEDVRKMCEQYGATMLKMPWSGSGRGVRPVTAGGLNEKDVAWVRRTLTRQGGVEVEPIYNKVQDFAMEFWAEDRRVRYEGLSVFETTPGGVYAGNLVASEMQKVSRLAQYVDPSLLQAVRQRLVILLNEADVPAWYTGPLGIDMMIVENTPPSSIHRPRFSVHPLVEINLRMTMGWVALQLQQKLAEGEVGTFKIDHSNGQYSALFIKNGI